MCGCARVKCAGPTRSHTSLSRSRILVKMTGFCSDENNRRSGFLGWPLGVQQSPCTAGILSKNPSIELDTNEPFCMRPKMPWTIRAVRANELANCNLHGPPRIFEYGNQPLEETYIDCVFSSTLFTPHSLLLGWAISVLCMEAIGMYVQIHPCKQSTRNRCGTRIPSKHATTVRRAAVCNNRMNECEVGWCVCMAAGKYAACAHQLHFHFAVHARAFNLITFFY